MSPPLYYLVLLFYIWRMLRYSPLIALLVLSLHSFAQQPRSFNLPLDAVVDIAAAPADLNIRVNHLEAPRPDGDSWRSFLIRQKIASASRFSAGYNKNQQTSSSLPAPATGKGFATTRTLTNGNQVILAGGLPNDNTLAVSKDGMVLIGVNSFLYGYDSKADTLAFGNNVLNLATLGGGGIMNYYFDPKLIYDELSDRFILIFLRNSSPASSAVVVCFSETNNPAGKWYRYYLPGNPLNNNRWTDYPAVSITKDHVFITANLIVPNEPWQTGFDGSIIWQLDKNAGFSAAASVNALLYPTPKYNNRFIRNLCPVNGALNYAERPLFLSNRNFDLVNDSIFLVELFPDAAAGSDPMKVSMMKSDHYYGVPPNGKQFDTPPNMPAEGLQTNDARILGAIMFGKNIQFVANSHDTLSGKACVYHGRITSDGQNYRCTGTIFSDPVLDIAYPNIAAAGNESCEEFLMVVCDYTSTTDFPGTGAYYTDGKENFSPLMRIKDGENYVDRLPGTYERWGDYSGAYRQGKEPVIWVSGFYGTGTKLNSTFTTEVFLPDTSRMRVSASLAGNPAFCQARLNASVSGASSPVAYFWDNSLGTDSLSKVCNLSTHKLMVQDQRGCRDSLLILTDTIFALSEATVYPNPSNGELAIQFTSEIDQTIRITVYDETGRIVVAEAQREIKSGLNQLMLDVFPLPAGLYELVVVNDKSVLLKKRIVRL